MADLFSEVKKRKPTFSQTSKKGMGKSPIPFKCFLINDGLNPQFG
jgi:hypothetical protein